MPGLSIGKRLTYRTGLSQGGGLSSGRFNPATIFSAGGAGVYYDCSSLANMKQLSNGTTAVTTAGDPVGYLQDLSGGGFNAVQATAGFRPLYQTYNGYGCIEFDGTDDLIASATSTVPLGPEWNIVVAFKRGTGTGQFAMANGTSASADYIGNFLNTSNRYSANSRSITLGYASNSTPFSSVNALMDTQPYVVSFISTIAPGNLSGQINSSALLTAVSNWTTASTSGNARFYPGPLLGNTCPQFKLFGFFMINRQLSAAESSALKTYMGSICGVTV